MSLAELMSQGIGFIEVGLLCMSVYLTVVTGYLIAAYNVGTRLTAFQLFTVTFLFLSFALILTLATFACLSSAISMFGAVQAAGEEGKIFTALSYSAYVTPGIQVLGIAVSVRFMFEIRRDRHAETSGPAPEPAGIPAGE